MEPLDGSLSESIPMSSLCTNSTYNQSPCFSVHYASMYSKLFYPVGGMDFNAKLISKMELLLPKLVGEGLALLLVTTMLL